MAKEAKRLRAVESSKDLPLPRALLLSMHELMLKTRVTEERLISMYKSGHGYFWIGGPGEEAFNVPLGLLIKKGQGLDYDFLHFHYRQLGTMLAMGEDPMHSLRQMKNTATDPYSGGRNFAGHFAKKEWNVVPVSSPIEVQYAMAPGTARAQKRHGGDSITIVTGGDAGAAEGDFASCLVWSSRNGDELPVLIIVTNNHWGISTSYSTQWGVKQMADRATAFGIKNKTIDGNDPVTAYEEIAAAMKYVRTERRPFLLEANVSRLYGHSSASGANYVTNEVDGLKQFEARLSEWGLRSQGESDALRKEWTEKIADMARLAKDEPQPDGKDIWKHVFKGED